MLLRGAEMVLRGLILGLTAVPYSIDQGENTTQHLFGLLARFLNEKLPAGPR